MKANETSLNRFLSQPDTQFVIPVYQRNYDWTQAQCKQLLDDVLKAGTDDETTAHFIGSIVYVHDGVFSTSETKELTIIDGQQRLTTVTLIYLTLYQLARNLKNQSLENRINETYLINKFTTSQEKLKLRPTENNNQALKYLLRGDQQEEYTIFSRLINNFNYFATRIVEENYEIALNGLNKLAFVEISLDRDKDNPQRIFESLNSTGLELAQADLIRNYILMGLSRKDQNQIYEDYWKAIEDLAKENATNTSRVSDFIRDYLTLENKKIPNKNSVYQAFKDKYPTASAGELTRNLQPIKSLAKYYNKILNPASEPDSEIRLQLEYVNRLEINVTYPFLMKVYDDYAENLLTKLDFVEVLELIQSFAWRRFIVGLPTNALNKIFMRLYEDVNLDRYLESIQKALLKRKGSQRFPRDTEVVNALREKDMYGIKPKNRVYFLERLENYNNKEYVPIDDNENITIEHIFPQNPDLTWKTQLGENDYRFIEENYLNTIANLTLSGNNGKLGNKSFSEKKNMNVDDKEQGYKFSRLWLNRYLLEVNSWGKEQLEKRFKIIEARFLTIWKFPSVSIEEETDFNEMNIFDAEDPTNKKLEYAIFDGRKLEVTEVSKLFYEVMETLFDVHPQTFFTSELDKRLGLTKDASSCRQPFQIDETYYIEAHLSSKEKFERIKRALAVFGFEDELTIKYKEN